MRLGRPRRRSTPSPRSTGCRAERLLDSSAWTVNDFLKKPATQTPVRVARIQTIPFKGTGRNSAAVDRLDDPSLHVTQASPDAVTDHVVNDVSVAESAVRRVSVDLRPADYSLVNLRVVESLSPLESMVSRVGIEPTTRRLRVCCSAN